MWVPEHKSVRKPTHATTAWRNDLIGCEDSTSSAPYQAELPVGGANDEGVPLLVLRVGECARVSWRKGAEVADAIRSGA